MVKRCMEFDERVARVDHWRSVSGFILPEGLEPLHLITSTQTYNLAVELGDWEGNFASATYTNFSVSSAADNFRLQLQYVGGTASQCCLLLSLIHI